MNSPAPVAEQPVERAFTARFDSVWSRLRRADLGQRLAMTALVLLVGVAGLAAADFALELSWSIRAAGLGLLGLAVLALAGAALAVVLRRWTRPKTAVEIERQFPELGQRVRTTVQFTGPDALVQAGGVAPTLAEALQADTAARAEPLPLDLVVPTRRMFVLSGLAMLALVAMGLFAAFHTEWRVAVQRALLGRQPWTELAVKPGNTVVTEGQDLTVALTLTGRTNRKVLVAWRVAGDPQAAWTEREFTESEATAFAARSATFALKLEKVNKPLEYRVAADKLTQGPFRVDVRYPLKLVAVQAELTPPAYTGLKPTTQKDANLHGLEGTKARLQFELDRAPAKAAMIVSPAKEPKKGQPKPEPNRIPLKIDGAKLTASLELTEDQIYTIEAESADGMKLADNKHRIRVRPDQPPSIVFEDPPEALEVHPLVEVLMKARARDDFGLSKAGVVFQVNNEDEHTLLLEDFAAALKEGNVPKTQALLEKMLPLEHFELTQKDSVTYYAFAEDNFPRGARRSETDLRFVDIRPFRRTYRLADPAEPMPSNRKPLASLEELIARQRYALNRTMRLAKRPESADADLNALDKLIEFEGKLATSTDELAAALQSLEVDGADLLFQAKDAMLAAVDSLQVGKYENATLQERDALRYLIEGRDKVQMSISKKPPKIQAQIRQLDRTQAQKLRKPKDDEEMAMEVVEKLKQLAMQEDFVYESLSGIRMEGPMPPAPPSDAKGNGNATGKPDIPPKDAKPGENKPDDKPGEKPEEGKGAGPTREELEQKQADIALEAYEVQKMLDKLQGISDLAKERMAAAIKGAEEVSTRLAGGQTDEAGEEARKTAGAFKELASNVEGLVAGETAEQIAIARDLSDELSALEAELADALDQPPMDGQGQGQQPGDKPQKGGGKPGDKPTGKPGGRGRGNMSPEDLARQAASLAESGKSLEDILKAVAKSDKPADQEAVQQIQTLLQEGKLTETIEKMQALVDEVRSAQRSVAALGAADVAENLDAAARKLDVLHRQIVAPRVAELMKLEEQARNAADKLENLETETQITQWHEFVDGLLQDLEDANVDPKVIEEVRDEMRNGGWGGDRLRGWGWVLDGRRYGVPVGYTRVTRNLVKQLQSQIQELVLKEMLAAGEEAAPPQYERLIEKYYEILSSELQQK